MNDLQQTLLDAVARAPAVVRLREALGRAKNNPRIAIRGLRAGSLPAAVGAVVRDGPDGQAPPWPAVMLVTANHERAVELFDDLRFFGYGNCFHYPKPELLPYEADEPPLEEQVKHLEFLHALASRREGAPPLLCVTSIEALFPRVPPLDILRAMCLPVEWGEPLDTAAFADRAAAIGYTRVATVEARGEFAVRGGIVDIFPVNTDNPLRIDLFGTEIESMRWFDVHTQRSLRGEDNLERVMVLPARQRVVLEAALAAAGHAALPTLPDLLPEGSLLIIDTPETYPVLDERHRQITTRQFAEHGAGRPEPARLFATLAEIEAAGRRFTQVQHSLILDTPGLRTIAAETSSFETVKPSLEHYITQVRRRLADGFTVVVVCDNDGQAQRMEELFGENEIGAVQYLPGKPGRETLPPRGDLGAFADAIVTVGDLHAGFVFPDARLFVVTDREIFGRYKRRHVYRKVYKSTPIADPREIRTGDFVVHLDHGIGRFEGIRTQTVDGRTGDYLELVYADNGRLLVPIEKIAYVHKYSGPEQAAPALDTLGGKKWLQRRRKSREDIEKLAKQLLDLYARRAAARGYACGPDTPWQREFEASFLYTETPDQLRAIAEVKADMMSDKPMDRLVCGDVGYGKTEVAIRAAFKAIQERRQVALLCPTTILAQQHFTTFRERFADYPIRVEMLSRFNTEGETRRIIAALRDGTVDMVVGTHMLLSKRVEFARLGLVIVDEEQRFGVAQKERLKELRTSVDFLTLTATPIPRTLYMALSGLRDMSLINTPPADRQPIKTRVIHWDREQIEEAILRELNRGGQVFFVHNRVQTIHEVATRLREIVPSARIAIGHGQMPDDDLEQVMLDFIDGKIDILVSTTIIENGVDIPNVNTIIINRADAFGLAQLYQLRGRVGRESRQAYAYLIVPAGQGITEQAVARLAAIQEFTELGVGFNIAMRDMEIRGAGNLLGREQHGSMCAVGFELYCRMLEEAVESLRGTMLGEEQAPEVEIQWKVSAHIPPQYVPVESQRVMLYKRLVEARTLEELDELAAEMRDRYGEVRREVPAVGGAPGKARKPVIIEDLPEPVENLFAIARMRLLGRRLGIAKITGTPLGFRIVRDGAVEQLGPLVQPLLRNGNPKVYTDDPHALEFAYSDWRTRGGPAECAAILAAIAPG